MYVHMLVHVYVHLPILHACLHARMIFMCARMLFIQKYLRSSCVCVSLNAMGHTCMHLSVCRCLWVCARACLRLCTHNHKSRMIVPLNENIYSLECLGTVDVLAHHRLLGSSFLAFWIGHKYPHTHTHSAKDPFEPTCAVYTQESLEYWQAGR